MAPRSRTFLKIFITALLILLVDLKTNTHSALGGVVPGQTKRVDGLNPGEVGEEELPKLSHDEEMILHALFGGLGEVIEIINSSSSNTHTVRAPVFGRHQFFGTSEHYGKAHGSLLSG